MANEFRAVDAHSAEYFGDTRDYWWNPDYIKLTGRRLGFDQVRNVLDVGCRLHEIEILNVDLSRVQARPGGLRHSNSFPR